MTTNLSRFIKEERIKQGLNYAEVSKKIGYKNINKGMRRVIDLEREGVVNPEVLDRIVDALELDQVYVDQLIQEDKELQKREFEEWVNTPIKWHLIIRWMPAVYGEREIPGYIKTEQEAIDYAKSFAREKKLMLWLVLSRKVNYHIDAGGNIKSMYEVTKDFINLPYAEIK